MVFDKMFLFTMNKTETKPEILQKVLIYLNSAKIFPPNKYAKVLIPLHNTFLISFSMQLKKQNL